MKASSDRSKEDGAATLFISVSNQIRAYSSLPPNYQEKGFYSHLIQSILQVQLVERGHLTSLLAVKPPVVNANGGLHGGAIAAIAELMSIACARTVVAEDKELFLGELSLSYLYSAPAEREMVIFPTNRQKWWLMHLW